jgi:hypothetical protein
VNSMQKILSAIDWNAIEQSSLDSFFDWIVIFESAIRELELPYRAVLF